MNAEDRMGKKVRFDLVLDRMHLDIVVDDIEPENNEFCVCTGVEW